jgi:rhodanese-related sulfurtransferase
MESLLAAARARLTRLRHGFVSSLVAAQLQKLGFPDATDVEGGFHAWARAGLPVDAVVRDR